MDVPVKDGGAVHLDDVLRWSKRPTSDVDDAVEDFTKYLEKNHVNNVNSLHFSTRGQKEKNITDRGLLVLVRIMQSGLLRNLEVLDLTANRVGDEAVVALATTIHSGHLPNLHTLNLAANLVRDAGAVALAEVIQSGQLCTLRHFSLGSRFGDRGALAFSKMLQSSISSTLRTFSLSGKQMSDAGVVTLSESLQSNHLTSLDRLAMMGNTIGNVGTMALGKALQSIHLSNLQTLQLSFDGGVEGASSLARSLQSSHLTNLKTLHFLIGYEGAEALVEQLSSNLPNLQELSLTVNPGPTDYTVPEVSATMLQSGSGKGLEKLWFYSSGSHGRWTKTGAVILAEFFNSGRLTNLQGMSLQNNQVGIQGAKAVAKLLRSAHVSNLRILDLGDTGIGNAGTIILAQSFQSSQASNLQKLVLRGNGITDEGAEALTESFQSGHFENLEQLKLSKNGFGDAGAKALAVPLQSGHLRSLRRLWLQNNGVEDAGLVALAKAFGSGHLMKLEDVYLYSTHTRFKNEGIVEIARVLETSDRYLPRLRTMGLFWVEQKGFDAELSQAAKQALSRAYRGNAFLTAFCWWSSPGWTFESWEKVATDTSFWQSIDRLRGRNEGRVASIKALEGEEAAAGRNAKVFLCGDPGVGKTTLRKSLKPTWKDWSWKKSHESPTRGIEVSHVKKRELFQDEPIELAVWDLAGQSEYHVLHSACMPDLALADGEATFFVLVCKGPKQRGRHQWWQKHILHWLRFISSYSRKECHEDLRRRVFVVLNCFDDDRSNYDSQAWAMFLTYCCELFKPFLKIHPKLSVLNARKPKQVNPFKKTLREEAKVVLQKRMMPKLCLRVQEMCQDWADKQQSYPVLGWQDFSNIIGRGWFSEEKFKAATAYLHEVGHLILFKEGWKGTAVESGAHEDLVILNPQWFCQKVVGELLLPDEMLRYGEISVRNVIEPDGALPLTRLDKLNVPEEKKEEAIHILSRLGLCYQLNNKDIVNKVFFPALIKKDDDEDPFQWSAAMICGDHDPAAWVMGFSLVMRGDSWLTTLLPDSLLRRLQVDLAQDERIGGRCDSEYRAGKSRIWFKHDGMDVLIEFANDYMDPQQDQIDVLVNHRIDVLVNPLVKAVNSSYASTSKSASGRGRQVDVAQQFVDRILEVSKVCCLGVDLERRIVKPYRSSAEVTSMHQRNIKMGVEEMVDRMKKDGPRATNWRVGGEQVEEEDLLSDKDLQSVYYSTENKYNLIRMAVEKMDLLVSTPNRDDFVLSEEVESHIPSTSNIAVEEEKPDPQTDMILKRLDGGFKQVGKELDGGFNKMAVKLDQLLHDMKDVKDGLHRILREQKSLVHHVQSLEAFSVLEKERSVPRYAYLAKPGNPNSWLRIKHPFVEPCRLHFYCEAPHGNHTLHVVDGQKGIDVSKLKDWAKKLAPILEWTLKIAFVLVKVAGTAVIPGLGIFIPDIPDGILSSEAQITTGIAELLQSSHATFGSAGDRQSRVTGLGHSRGGGGVPNELEIRGAARAAVKEVFQGLNSREFEQQVALRRVRLSDASGGTSHVVWICDKCSHNYGHQAREI